MKLHELLAQLEDLLEVVGEDAEVRIAHQPNHPLRLCPSHVTAFAKNDCDDEVEVEGITSNEEITDATVWLVCNRGMAYNENPYDVPRDLWR